jgi:hypothetical protein
MISVPVPLRFAVLWFGLGPVVSVSLRPRRRPCGSAYSLMSSVKHRTHDWDISTRRREVDWVMVVQRRGRDLKTSVIKL